MLLLVVVPILLIFILFQRKLLKQECPPCNKTTVQETLNSVYYRNLVLTIDDFLSTEDFENLNNFINADTDKISWVFGKNTNAKERDLDLQNSSQFVHIFVMDGEVHGNVEEKRTFLPLTLKLNKIFSPLYVHPIRIKVNARLKSNTEPLPHIDQPSSIDSKVYSMVFYLNDDESHTHLYKEFADNEETIPDHLELHRRVKTRANSCVIFHAARVHKAANSKVNQVRRVVNYMFVLKTRPFDWEERERDKKEEKIKRKKKKLLDLLSTDHSILEAIALKKAESKTKR